MKKTLGTLAAAALLLVACGDDDDASDISKADFVEQANAICTAGNAEIEAADSPTSEEEAVTFVEDVLVPSVREQIEDIRALGFPEGDEDELDSIFDRTEAQLDDLEDNAAEAVAGEDDPFAEINDDLNAYGLTVCGDDG